MTLTLPGPVGLWTTSLDALDAGATADQVAALDEQGWDALWFGEAYGREAFTAAQLYLGASRRLAVATGIASIYGRDAVAANAASRTLHAMHPGRFVAGLGVSHAPMVERMRGHSYGRPLQAMREYLDAMDAAPFFAAGDPGPAPRVLAALGPKMLELSRDRADGAHPYLVTPEHTATARETLGAGPLLAVEQAVVLSEDPDVVRRRAHWHLEIYTGLPNYRASWVRQGFAEDDFVRGGSDRLKSGMVVGGDEATILARVQAHLDAGADHVCLQVLADDAFTVPREDWARLAPAMAEAGAPACDTGGVTQTDRERIDRLYAEAEQQLDGIKAQRVWRGPVSLIAVYLGLSLVVGLVAAVDLRRLQSPRGTALAWTGAAVFGDCTGYLELSVPDPSAIVPDRRSDAELCRDLRARTEDARADAPRIDIVVLGQLSEQGDTTGVQVEVRRPARTRAVLLTLRRQGDGWVVVRTAPTCLAVGCG